MSIAQDVDGGAYLKIKAVPGAKRDQIAGRLGDRLKVRVSQPPENGKANQAICELIAHELGVRAQLVTLERGQTHPEKTVFVHGVNASTLEARWP